MKKAFHLIVALIIVSSGFCQTAEEYFSWGSAKILQGDYLGAIESNTKGLEINPSYVIGYYNRGIAKEHLDDFKGAIEDYGKAIKINPNYIEAHEARAKIKENILEDYNGANDDYNSIIKIDPNYLAIKSKFDKSLQFLKRTKSCEAPTIKETLEWIEKNMLFENSSLTDNNLYSFKVLNPEQLSVAILLRNLDPDNINIFNENLTINGWKSNLIDLNLGYVTLNNKDYNGMLGGVTINTFKSIDLALPRKSINDKSIQNKLVSAFKYLGLLSSDKYAKVPFTGACFVEDSKVSINQTEIKKIGRLSIGDSVLSYDLESGEFFNTEIVNIDSVIHDNLVELYFNNDTITCTSDHPFYLENKGWCSLEPLTTMKNYSNYSTVEQMNIGDLFLLKNGDNVTSTKLIGYSFLKEEEMTYTITELTKGNTYFVNGVLTGVEDLKKYCNQP